MHWFDGSGWWMVFGGIWMILFWGGIIALIIWAIKRLSERGGGERRNAMDIARERYARGEISREQYEQLRKDLSQ